MPASKKRIQNRGALNVGTQQVPAALRDWVHIWHGVRVNNGTHERSIFHAGSRLEELPFWKQFIRLPANSLFPRVVTRANPRRPAKDFLYVLLNMRWPMLLSVLFCIFLVNIFFFAVISRYACGEPETFLAAFDLSYQTFTTIGFGIVYPTRSCSNIIMTVESFASMMITSAITGLVFAKFAKPQAKVAFSKVCAVQPYGKKYLALVVRVANATQSRDVTHDVIMEAAFKVNLLRVEHKTKHVQAHEDEALKKQRDTASNADHEPVMQSRNGDEDQLWEPDTGVEYSRTKVLSSYNLKLLQNNFITFRMGVAVVHLIDESSPLYGLSQQDIEHSDMIVEVAMSGVDSTLQDTVSERYIYTAADIKWGFRFAELLDFNEGNSEVLMNFEKLSEVEPAPIDDKRYIRSLGSSGSSGESGESSESFQSRNGHRDGRLSHHGKRSRSKLNEALHDNQRRHEHPLDEEETMEEVEAPAEYSERVMSARSTSSEQDRASAARTTSLPPHPHPHVAMSKKTGPSKFGMGLEPLFEPLLQQPFGTQRLPEDTSSGETQRNLRSGSGAMRMWNGMLNRAANQDESGGGDADESRRSFHQISRSDSTGARARARSGSTNRRVSDSKDEHSIPEVVIPVRHKRQLNREMSGAVILDEDDTSTVSNPGDAADGSDASDSSGSEFEEEGGVEEDNVERMGVGRRRATSAISIDVEDTPRFLRIAPLHIPKSFDFMRFYQSALHVGWPKITVVFVLAFLALNFGFGLFYWFQMGGISSYSDLAISDYELAFFMSVHTLATIGYGSIAPTISSVYMNVVVFIESMVGIIAVTIITGIAWSKFARPRAHIHFSSKVVITRIYGHRCLVFRAANTRHSGEVHENFFRIGVILTNRRTGLRQMYDVPLVTAEWPSIKLPATLIHVIDESSPFYKFRSMDDLSQSRVAVIALLTGLDTTFSENVYARRMYFWDDFACDMRFADFALIERDRVIVDYTRFDQLIPEDREEEHADVTTPVAPLNGSSDQQYL